MMSLGQFRFSVKTAAYHATQKTNHYRWQAQPVLGTAPRAQFLGIGAETLNLEGVIYPFYKGGLKQLDAMRTQAQRGKPLLLIDAQGAVQGQYVITTLNEHQTTFCRDGRAQKIDFSLSLTRYHA